MGLDSSIYKVEKISDNWEEQLKAIKNREQEPKSEAVYKETEVLYLRKSNQIHNYIVQKFADGRDECQRIYLDIEDLRKLKKLCDRVLRKSVLYECYLFNNVYLRSYEIDNEVELKDGTKKKAGDIEQLDLIHDENGFIFVEDVIVEKSENSSKTILVEGKFCFKGKKLERDSEMIAQKLLPTKSGFFFGSTEYDELYLKGLKSCSEQLAKIIKDYENNAEKDGFNIEFYYQASW